MNIPIHFGLSMHVAEVWALPISSPEAVAILLLVSLCGAPTDIALHNAYLQHPWHTQDTRVIFVSANGSCHMGRGARKTNIQNIEQEQLQRRRWRLGGFLAEHVKR